jgi:hypothetical protein
MKDRPAHIARTIIVRFVAGFFGIGALLFLPAGSLS